MGNDQIEQAISRVIKALGDDITRPGLKDTPKRVAKSLRELTSGQGMSPSDVVKDAIFPCEAQGMVLQRDIEFFSLCEHHMLPFFGKVHIAYLPHQRIIGLSKLGRIVDVFSKRLQVQENLTHEISKSLIDLLDPLGIAVVMEANHLCMMMRGVKKQGGLTVTSEYHGMFDRDEALKTHFLGAIK